MLRRKMLDTLREWRAKKNNECLLVKGARQIGKSFIIEQFGKEDFASYILVDFVKRPELKAAFRGSLEPSAIYAQLSLLIPDARFIEGDTLLFIDEIQECPQARSALKYLAIDGRFDVVASGSLLGIQYMRDERDTVPSIPVGYERAIEMHGLDFEEFLWARGYGEEAIASLRGYLNALEPVPWAVHENMMHLLREYLAIGGMPAVV